MKNYKLINILSEFLENEARSCSMDFGCVTPLYVIGCGEEQWLSKILPLRWKTLDG